MKRVLVIGSGGAGKSTFARRVAERTGLPLIHLDALYWRAGWQETPKQEWAETVEQLVRQDAWVMDGNYGGTLDRRLEAADTVIFLDLPRWICLHRVVKRRIRFHGRSRPDMAEGCSEQLSWEFLRWIWSYPKDRRPKLLSKLEEHARGRNMVILRSPSAVERFLESLPMALIILLLAVFAAPAAAQKSACRLTSSLPAAVQPFVERGSCAIALERGDLDRDGRSDYLLVVERPAPDPENGRHRSLLVITAGSGGLRLAAKADGVVLCSRCGGVWGDPLEGIQLGTGEFTVQHFAGSAWRWRLDFTFAYSRRDRAWQLVRINDVSFHTSDPEKTMKIRVSRPPRDFGKIDLREFDAETWMRQQR